jgi:hypothetical protein
MNFSRWDRTTDSESVVRSQREKFIHVIKEMLLFEESVDGVGTVSRKLMREKVKPDSKANSRA